MRQESGTGRAPAEQVIKDIRRATHKQYGAEEKICIVLEGLRGEKSIAALCRERLAGDTARAATSDEVNVLRKEAPSFVL